MLTCQNLISFAQGSPGPPNAVLGLAMLVLYGLFAVARFLSIRGISRLGHRRLPSPGGLVLGFFAASEVAPVA